MGKIIYSCFADSVYDGDAVDFTEKESENKKAVLLDCIINNQTVKGDKNMRN